MLNNVQTSLYMKLGILCPQFSGADQTVSFLVPDSCMGFLCRNDNTSLPGVSQYTGSGMMGRQFGL